jgi:putative hydrolase of the HAD superfamily
VVKAVIFDLDDTLISEKEYIKSGFKAVSREIEKDFSISNTKVFNKMLGLFNESAKNVFNRVLGYFNIQYNKDYVNELVNLYRIHEPNIKFFDDVIPTLIQLKDKGYKLGIITDGYKDSQNKKLDSLNCRHMFDSIILTDEYGSDYWKPNERPYILMADQLKVKLCEMIYIGDNENKDFVTANKLGIKTICVKRENRVYYAEPFNNNYKAKYTVQSLNEFINKNIIEDEIFCP